MTYRFVVMGAGAIGCYVGGRLAAAGADVTFVARSARRAEIAGHGLSLASFDGFSADLVASSVAVAETAADAAAKPGPLMVLLATKGGATAKAAAELGAALPAGTPVLSLQNGVDNVARIAAAAPALVALAGMVPFNVTLDHDADGRLACRQTTSGVLHVIDHPATRAVEAIFFRAGLPLAFSSDMAAVQWGKLLLNLNNPVNALSGLPLREELLDPDYRWVLAALQDEAMAVMKAAGIRPAKVGAAPPWAIPLILRLPTWAFSRIAASMLTIDPSARSSMWDDVKAGRVTEIDDLCGAVVRLGARVNVATPRNAAMIGLIESHSAGQRLDGATLRQRVAAA
ncbi:2-dehydropantoate 2-reductase [Phreatobacter aquaticus]|uniref:2-dehydropantoate 2-reductase n=1 Tax=Phreatobacter aquaticus TaxID=2570229 RepID=A0A4D7QM40_9HYPH|nr:2-dehydropantoate 2-reductase [Phreatobacter aquaticus]QCK86709.1 2-dehydropantoate 2-reductase [Phreatobacter aquaticus]